MHKYSDIDTANMAERFAQYLEDFIWSEMTMESEEELEAKFPLTQDELRHLIFSLAEHLSGEAPLSINIYSGGAHG